MRRDISDIDMLVSLRNVTTRHRSRSLAVVATMAILSVNNGPSGRAETYGQGCWIGDAPVFTVHMSVVHDKLVKQADAPVQQVVLNF